MEAVAPRELVGYPHRKSRLRSFSINVAPKLVRTINWRLFS